MAQVDPQPTDTDFQGPWAKASPKVYVAEFEAIAVKESSAALDALTVHCPEAYAIKNELTALQLPLLTV